MRRTPSRRARRSAALRAREHVDRHADRVDDRRDLLRRREPRRVDAVGAGVAVGDEPRDRVVEVVDAVEVVLRAARQHERRVERAGRLRGLGDALGASATSSIRPATGFQSSIEQPAAPASPRQPDGLGDAARVVGEAALAVDVERQVGRRSELARRDRRARRASPGCRACRAPTRSPRSSSRAPRSRARRGCAPTRRPTGSASRRAPVARGARESARGARRPRRSRSSALPGRDGLGLDLVALDRRGDHGRLDRPLVGERLQRGDRDVVAVDLEEAAQLRRGSRCGRSRRCRATT